MKLDYPATQRNKDAILDVLRAQLPDNGTVLEVAAGSGQHAVHFAAGLPHLLWQPTSREAEERASIDAHAAEADLPNVLPALDLDVELDWPDAAPDAIVCINMIHIATWSAAEALFQGSARRLAVGAPLITYGPYRFGGATAPSNEAFDASLRRRNPEWGVRDVDDLDALAESVGLSRAVTEALPANNHAIVWRRT